VIIIFKKQNKMKNTFFIALALIVLIVANSVIECQQLKRNNEQCSRNEECLSKSCREKVCQPMRCRNDKTCLRAGLADHYCKRRRLKVFASECTPKRGRLDFFNFL
jgi:hypothetical protein